MSHRHVGIAIGPGHYVKQSGVNTGAYDAGSDTSEFDLNTEFAEKLNAAFIESGYISRITPRTRIFPRLQKVKEWMDEYFIETDKLPVILYFSLHQNSGPPSAHGAEVFVSSAESKSWPMARAALDAIIGVGGLRDRGIKYAPFTMLRGDAWRNADVDVNMVYSCLIEFGFISSSIDRKVIKDPEMQTHICRSIVDNVHNWLISTSIGFGG